MKETVHRFGSSSNLVGILTRPHSSPTGPTAAILMNAGIVHRVGPQRLYVHLARFLADRGIPVFRFDFSGFGDSPSRSEPMPFRQSCIDDTGAALDLLVTQTGCRKFALFGLCSGADAAMQVAAVESRICGLVSINARRFGLQDEAFARMRPVAVSRHYRRLMLHSSFRQHSTRRILRGRFEWRSALRALQAQWTSVMGARSLRQKHLGIPQLLQRGIPFYCLHSEADEGLDHLQVLCGGKLEDHPRASGFQLEVLPGCDHTFTMRWSQRQLQDKVWQWWQANLLEPRP